MLSYRSVWDARCRAQILVAELYSGAVTMNEGRFQSASWQFVAVPAKDQSIAMTVKTDGNIFVQGGNQNFVDQKPG